MEKSSMREISNGSLDALMREICGQIIVRHNGIEFTTVEQIKAYVDKLDEAERYPVQSDLLGQMMAKVEDKGEKVKEIWHYMKESRDWRRHLDEKELEERRDGATRIAETNTLTAEATNKAARRDKLAEMKRAIAGAWEGSCIREWLAEAEKSPNFQCAIRQLARHAVFEDGVLRINAAVLARLNSSGRGISTKREVMTVDVNNARKMRQTPPAVAREALSAVGMRIGKFGFVEEGTASILDEEEGTFI